MKRILSFILSINLIFILVPGTVLAAPSWPSAVSIEADGGTFRNKKYDYDRNGSFC